MQIFNAFFEKIFAVWLLVGFSPALAWLQVRRLRFCECKVSAFFGDGQMFFLIFLVGVGTHYIYRGLGMDLFGFWIFGWILGGFCGMKEIKKSASPKKNCACGDWRGRLWGCGH